MSMENADAISFANNFFVLADGLVPGINKYLAKEVILNWFGKTIKGKHKVAAFLNNRKITTAHHFPTIIPSDGFEYHIYQSKKPKVESEVNNNNESVEAKDQSACKSTPNCECADSKPETDKSKLMSEEKASGCDLNEQHDLNSLNSLDISEMKHAANKTKVEEVMSQFKNMKMKCGHRDDPEVRNTTSNPMLKCVQAKGLLRCSEKHHKPALNSNLNYLNSNRTWTRNCKLSIAYSIGKPEIEKVVKEKEQKSRRSSEGPPPSQLPTFEEVIALSSQIVPNTDHFGGYLQDDYHFYSERREFLKQFRADVAKEKHDEQPSSTVSIAGNRSNSDFVFDYSIHYIGYETEGDNEDKEDEGENEDSHEDENDDKSEAKVE